MKTRSQGKQFFPPERPARLVAALAEKDAREILKRADRDAGLHQRYGVPTCAHPTTPTAIYMRNMYHEFFWGPFADEGAAVKAIKKLDIADPRWDEDPFCMIYGANPLPASYVSGFPFVPDEMRQRIEAQRRQKLTPLPQLTAKEVIGPKSPFLEVLRDLEDHLSFVK